MGAGGQSSWYVGCVSLNGSHEVPMGVLPQDIL